MHKEVAVLLLLAMPAWGLPLYSGDNPPFQYFSADGKQVVGLSVDIVTAMSQRAGIPISHHHLPWARSVATAQKSDNGCVYSLARLPERESRFRWIGPLTRAEWAFFARDDFTAKLTSLDDARRYRIGTAQGTGTQSWLAENGFKNIDLAPNDGMNARKLAMGRFDLWLAQVNMAYRFASEEGIENIRPVLSARSVDYYLACSLKTPLATINALRLALAQMQTDGSLRKLELQYLNLPAGPANR